MCLYIFDFVFLITILRNFNIIILSIRPKIHNNKLPICSVVTSLGFEKNYVQIM